MSKGLEALEDIILYLNASEPKGLYCENIEVIKQELDQLEKLENENQELKEENTKLKEVIKFLGEQLGLEPDLENHNLITDEGTIGFVNADEETMSILELLKEVLEDGDMD